MSLQTVMNLNHIEMLVSLAQTDEGVQSRLSNEHKSTAPSFPRRDKWGKHDNFEQQLIESQFNFVFVIVLRNSHGISYYSRRQNLHKTYI